MKFGMKLSTITKTNKMTIDQQLKWIFYYKYCYLWIFPMLILFYFNLFYPLIYLIFLSKKNRIYCCITVFFIQAFSLPCIGRFWREDTEARKALGPCAKECNDPLSTLFAPLVRSGNETASNKVLDQRIHSSTHVATMIWNGNQKLRTSQTFRAAKRAAKNSCWHCTPVARTAHHSFTTTCFCQITFSHLL